MSSRDSHWRSSSPSERRGPTPSIIETANDAFVQIDALGKTRDWNRQAETVFGWSRDEVLGASLADTIIPERYHQAHASGLQRFLETGEGPVLNRRIELEGLR